ncbi:MAG: hypothetical protein AUJ12_01405 [Alphaproteobacteria bacterium CG1_02_46_17]|nr:MAG: hypothetical protein AUJ12_01405 [Alphaproteobacteria bacterium CG1_02_46_17]
MAPVKRKYDAYTGVKYRYVIDEHTGRQILLPKAEHKGVIGGVTEFYDPKGDHKGHTLLCPDCEQAEMTYINPYKQHGRNKQVRGHFRPNNRKDNPGHASDCISDLRMNEDRDPKPDNKDYSKGPIIYINSLADEFNKLAGKRFKFGRKALFEEDEEGVLRFRDADLADRERFSVKTPHDLFRIMKRLDPVRLKDSRIIYGSSVAKWDHFLVRLGPKVQNHKSNQNHPSFYRFIELAKDLFAKEFHPVMLHFNASNHKIKCREHLGLPYRQVTLDAFSMAHNGQKVRVLPLVGIYNEQSMAELSKGGDFFALALPKELKRADGDPGLYFMIFDVHSPDLLVSKDRHELARAVGSRAKNMRASGKSGGGSNDLSP